jgi:hypothetical protein
MVSQIPKRGRNAAKGNLMLTPTRRGNYRPGLRLEFIRMSAAFSLNFPLLHPFM